MKTRDLPTAPRPATTGQCFTPGAIWMHHDWKHGKCARCGLVLNYDAALARLREEAR